MRFCAGVLILLATTALAQEAPRGLLRSGEATLFDRFEHKHRGRATFSFEHGIRDDPHRLVARDDWDLQFSGGQFYVDMAKDDRSRIVDLGAKKLSEITELPAAAAENGERVRAVESVLASFLPFGDWAGAGMVVRTLRAERELPAEALAEALGGFLAGLRRRGEDLYAGLAQLSAALGEEDPVPSNRDLLRAAAAAGAGAAGASA